MLCGSEKSPRRGDPHTIWILQSLGGILKLLALEPVGDAISEGMEISQSLRKKMKAALQRIYNAGFVHGDIARRNFCRTARGNVFSVDLERCRLSGNPSELVAEMDEVDGL